MEPRSQGTDPLAGLDEDLAAHREFVETRAPVYSWLAEAMRAELDGGEAAERLRAAWSERRYGAWYERPLLILTALRWAALQEGEEHPLYPAIGSPVPDEDAVSAVAARESIAADQHRFWDAVSSRYVQTNDPARAVAWIWPAAVLAEADPGRPLDLYDIGASAGLNLVGDLMEDNTWARTDQKPLRLEPLPPIRRRLGFDLRPLDPLVDDDANWLRALVWPGQDERARRLEAAIAAYRSAGETTGPPRVEAVSAGKIPPRLDTVGQSDPRALAYQTVMRDYVPEAELARYEQGMADWLSRSEPGGAVWIQLDVTEEARSGGPVLELTATLRGAEENATHRLAF
ncbi:MAG: DUF2332 family protein, partial [Solirubrobacterales bacterium]